MAPSNHPLYNFVVDGDDDDDELHPEELVDPGPYDEDFDKWERQESHRVGKDGRNDKCKTILEKLTLYEVARRLEKAFDLLQRPGLNLDIVNILYYMTCLQGTKADTRTIQYVFYFYS